MSKSHREYYFFVMMMIGVLLLTGCKKEEKNEVIQQFIETQMDGATCKLIYEDPEKAQTIFLDYFTEEGYTQYLEEAYGYLYPQLFNTFNVEQCKIHKIKCTNTNQLQDKSVVYDYEVSYTIKESLSNGKKSSMDMVDDLRITLDDSNKISKAIILNTSDIIEKLILDIKVQ